MDIDTEDFRHAVLQEIRQRFTAVLIEPVVDAVCLYGVETFEIQQRQRIFITSRVALVNGFQVGLDTFADAGVHAQSLLINFKQRAHVHNRAGELAGKMVGKYRIERIVAQHGLVQEACQHRLGRGGRFGFFADGVPQMVFFHV